jgi:uncharacterized protein (TIGR02271 family)
MRTHNHTVAVGVFEDRAKAQQAIHELKRKGFTDDQIGVAAKHDEDRPHGGSDETGSKAGTGAGVGAATGLGVGGLWGLGIVAGALPAIGPAIAGGVLASILTSAAAGAAAGGVIGALVGLGIPEDEAEYYHEEFNRGKILVTVRADDMYDEARDILQRNGAYDIHSHRESGSDTTTGRTSAHTATATSGHTAASTGTDSRHMELREERLHARPETTRTGEVDVRKEVTTERETIEVPIEREEVVVKRQPASGTHHSDKPIGEGDEIRIPVKEQRAHVEKETVSRGEVSVEKRKVQDTERVTDDVKKEQIKVEKRGDAKVRNR